MNRRIEPTKVENPRTMERSGSSDNASVNYQCNSCFYIMRVPYGRRGDPEPKAYISCPRCNRS